MIKELIEMTPIKDLPHSIIIQGIQDSGQDDMVKFASEHYEIPCRDITEDLTLDTIISMETTSDYYLYYVRMSNITEKEQNVILKFLEEPPHNAWIFLLVDFENKGRVLTTIINRCVIWHMDTYSEEDIEKLTDDPIIRKYAKTPKQVEMYSKINISEMYKFAESVIDNIARAYFSNCLVITSKLAFKDGDKGYPFKLFLRMLIRVCTDRYIQDDSYKLLTVHMHMCDALRDVIEFPLVNKEWLFNNLLLKIKQVMMS